MKIIKKSYKIKLNKLDQIKRLDYLQWFWVLPPPKNYFK